MMGCVGFWQQQKMKREDGDEETINFEMKGQYPLEI